MASREREYRWYLTGCARLGQTPLDESAFDARWQQFEEHAERLKSAEQGGSLPDVDAHLRAEMRQRMKDDPFVDAVLVGMAEELSTEKAETDSAR